MITTPRFSQGIISDGSLYAFLPPPASNARKEMIAALAVWKTQSKYKRYNRERAMKQYIEELAK